MNGWVKMHRDMLEWEWYDNLTVKSLFIHLILKANRAKGKWRGIEIMPGQRFTSIGTLSTELGLSEKQIRNALKKLKKTGEIDIKGASNGTMITICNYGSYQGGEQAKGEQLGKPRANKGQSKGNKQEGEERDNDKNKLNSDQTFIFSEFKRITSKNIRVFDRKAKSNLDSRLKEGYLIEDITTAIKNCFKDKYHIENPQYLTLEFILRADKLAKYSLSTKQTSEKFNLI